MLITRLFLFALAYALRATGGVYEGGIWDTLQACWLKSDSPSYLGIAENWYVTEGDPRFHIVFFPFYPICIAACNCIGQFLRFRNARFLALRHCLCDFYLRDRRA